MDRKKRKILILGGGISGLAMRYFLTQMSDQYEVVLLEKEASLGGVIGHKYKAPFNWALGPKTFQAGRTPRLNQLIEQLNLNAEKRFSNKSAKKRYLVKDGQLEPLPYRLIDFLKAPYRAWIKALLTEWTQPSVSGDETIWSFANRRFGLLVASAVFDPMALGVFGGDAKELSISACLPVLKEWEQTHGSVTRALLKRKKKKEGGKGLFTLQGGMSTLIKALQIQGKGEVYCETPVESIRMEQGQWCVGSSDQTWRADHLVSALPLHQLHLLQKVVPEVTEFIRATPCANIHYVTLIFDEDVFTQKGFGCIFPTDEGSDFLGIIFDSCLYKGVGHACTVMLRKPLASKVVIQRVQDLLHTTKEPLIYDQKPYEKALPQFLLHHKERVATLESALQAHHPGLSLIGNYLHGVSVEACVERAYQRALILSQ